ncbi:hypothetical protein SAMN05444392_10126 [Seinonella peptonophila]|uniref:Uncharacterized protein n=1 Tax=Seinonella peptonophila TaxID=112248 RepID=A0A1M4SL68_9BACL|nr:hypothetical protein [Seinonella peptonophila]SHE32898.1 hypothetical protein SAMN05444392_10126 [Seinonella peptonophila]
MGSRMHVFSNTSTEVVQAEGRFLRLSEVLACERIIYGKEEKFDFTLAKLRNMTQKKYSIIDIHLVLLTRKLELVRIQPNQWLLLDGKRRQIQVIGIQAQYWIHMRGEFPLTYMDKSIFAA